MEEEVGVMHTEPLTMSYWRVDLDEHIRSRINHCFVRSWQRPTWPKHPAISCYWLIDSATYLLIKIYSPVVTTYVAMSLYNINRELHWSVLQQKCVSFVSVWDVFCLCWVVMNVPSLPAVVNCTLLTAPSNGNVTLSGSSFMDTANFTCTTGYELVGTASLQCQGSGEWSDTVPTCQSEWSCDMTWMLSHFTFTI